MANKGYTAAAAAPAVMDVLSQKRDMPENDNGMIRPYTFAYNKQAVNDPISANYTPGESTRERQWFQPKFTPLTPYKAAGGGLMSLAGGGPVETMSNANAIGANTGYPMANVNNPAYAVPYQTPVSQNVVQGATDTGVNPMTGEQRFAEGGITGNGNLNLNIPLDLGGGGGSQSAAGYSSVGSQAGQQPAQPENPLASDSTWSGFQSKAQSMQDALTSTDMYKNMSALNDTMGGYYERSKGNIQGDTNFANYQKQMEDMQNQFKETQEYKNMHALGTEMDAYKKQFMQNYKSPASQTSTQTVPLAAGGMAYAQGGISTLGSYSDGGRLLKGPGDGMSDNIPAQIGAKQPARLADGEFVVPADVVSHLGNGSTDAGAKQLYKMMDRIRSQRTGKKKQAPEVNPSKAMPA